MNASDTAILPGEQECPNCGRPMSPRARLCPTCRAYRQQWKNWLAFYGSATGVIAIVVSAITFVSDVGPRVWASAFRPDAITTIYFEYPGKSAFVNSGAHDIVIQSISLKWSIPGAGDRPIDLPIGKLVKPGEILFNDVPPQSAEPERIDGAPWVRGNGPPPIAQIRDAFNIGSPDRCTVFHVYNAGHPFFQFLNNLYPSPLSTLSAQAFIQEYHTSTATTTTEPMGQINTAFIAISGCVPPASGEPGK